jgi:hypothetical protein
MFAAPQSRLTAWERKARETKTLCEAFCTHAASVSVQPASALAASSSDASHPQVAPLVSAVDSAATTFIASVDLPFLLRALALPLPVDLSDTFRRATVLLFRSRAGIELLTLPEARPAFGLFHSLNFLHSFSFSNIKSILFFCR